MIDLGYTIRGFCQFKKVVVKGSDMSSLTSILFSLCRGDLLSATSDYLNVYLGAEILAIMLNQGDSFIPTFLIQII